jgi:hypothetical protein
MKKKAKKLVLGKETLTGLVQGGNKTSLPSGCYSETPCWASYLYWECIAPAPSEGGC